jgi:hypothetical protein
LANAGFIDWPGAFGAIGFFRSAEDNILDALEAVVMLTGTDHEGTMIGLIELVETF